MTTKREYLEEFRRNGVLVTQQLILNKTYTGKAMKWAEVWVASQQRPRLALTLSIAAIGISVLAWLFPR